MALKQSQDKPWHKLGMTKKQYLAARGWKSANLSRARYEQIIMSIDNETFKEIRANAEADMLLEKLFGPDTVKELD